MSYRGGNLSALTYANGFTLWHYKTPDPCSEVCEIDYFREAVNMLRNGDMVMVNAAQHPSPNGPSYESFIGTIRRGEIGDTIKLRPITEVDL